MIRKNLLRSFILSLFFILFFGCVGGNPLAKERFSLSKESFLSGELISLFYKGKIPSGVMAELKVDNKESVRSKFYTVNKGLSLAILRVPLDIESGAYTIKIFSNGELIEELGVTLTFIKDKTEKIWMNDSMGAITSNKSALKKEQSRALYALFQTIDESGCYFDGFFTSPFKNGTQYRVTSLYHDKRSFYRGKKFAFSSFHKGIDYGAALGTEVIVTAPGRVVFAGERIFS